MSNIKNYLIQCREIVLYIAIDFEPEVGNELKTSVFDFTVIESPSDSEALFCMEDSYGSLWYAFSCAALSVVKK